MGAGSVARVSSAAFFHLLLPTPSRIGTAEWRAAARGWTPGGKEEGKTSAPSAPGPAVQGSENAQGTKFPGSTQRPWWGAQSLTLSKSGQSLSASSRAMWLAIGAPVSVSTFVSTNRVIPTTSPSASCSSSMSLGSRSPKLMTCVEQNAVSRSHQRLRCQSRPGDSSPRCGLGTQKPKGCPEGLGRVNGEAGELGAAATAPEAQSKLLRFPASPAQPQPCSTASAAAPAHHRGSLAEREEASERQALHHSALTLSCLWRSSRMQSDCTLTSGQARS